MIFESLKFHRQQIHSFSRGAGNLATVVLAVAMSGLLAGCVGSNEDENAELPAIAPARFEGVVLGAAREIEPGIMLREADISPKSNWGKVWIYLPKPKNNAPKTKLPCVLIAAAGSHLFDGQRLGPGDRPEHLPYVRAGLAVVAYETSGALKGDSKITDTDIIEAARRFRESDAGVGNAVNAIDFAVSQVPEIDKQQVISAGHSSAATLALLLAENEPDRIKACIAYAPVCDIEARIGPEIISEISKSIPDYEAFIKSSSPITGVAKIQCPVFIFHAEDDSIPEEGKLGPFVEKLKATNKQVTYVKVKSGGHYESMVNQGVPQAIKWLQQLKFAPEGKLTASQATVANSKSVQVSASVDTELRGALSAADLQEIKRVAEVYIQKLQAKKWREAYNSLHSSIRQQYSFEKYQKSWNGFSALFGHIKTYKYSSHERRSGIKPESVKITYLTTTDATDRPLDLFVDKREGKWQVSIFHNYQVPEDLEGGQHQSAD